jgi:hypothetical protein
MMMMMTSLMPYSNTAFGLNIFAGSGYNAGTNRYLPQFPQSSSANNCFPVFGNTGGFGGFGGSSTPSFPCAPVNQFGCQPQGDAWANIIQLVLGKLLHPAQQESEIYTKKHPKVRVHNDSDYREAEPKVVHRKKRFVDTNATKKADLPEGVSPLSYKALMNNAGYKTEAIDAVKEWQAYLTTYGKRLDTRVGREKWSDGAVNYLALLNDPKVRDLFMEEQPKLIGAYYNQVLRTLRDDDDVRATMKQTEQNAKVLAIVDNANKSIFGHRIFKNDA